jgi:HPt (histidine-containing phosphotransfer) domain-containing protein
MSSPPLVPDEPAIDREHLARMTMGQPQLEREVLTLFARQSRDLNLIAKLGNGPKDASAVAHTLKGAARAVGAFRVAEAALNYEAALRDGLDLTAPLDALDDAMTDAEAAIDAILKN